MSRARRVRSAAKQQTDARPSVRETERGRRAAGRARETGEVRCVFPPGLTLPACPGLHSPFPRGSSLLSRGQRRHRSILVSRARSKRGPDDGLIAWSRVDGQSGPMTKSHVFFHFLLVRINRFSHVYLELCTPSLLQPIIT